MTHQPQGRWWEDAGREQPADADAAVFADPSDGGMPGYRERAARPTNTNPVRATGAVRYPSFNSVRVKGERLRTAGRWIAIAVAAALAWLAGAGVAHVWK